jgi:hypothetical protein
MAGLLLSTGDLRMDRRTFARLVAGTCLLEPLALRAQQAGKIVRIGLLAPATELTAGRIDLEALRAGCAMEAGSTAGTCRSKPDGPVSLRSGSASLLPS